jgi:hypothetical protein
MIIDTRVKTVPSNIALAETVPSQTVVVMVSVEVDTKLEDP